jgi:antitoxin component of RelBE/YafQ-DinJ toxin-antitoxin module
MKNITVSVDDDVYRNARIKAAEADRSVSSLVRSFLIRLAEGQVNPDFDRLRRLQNETIARIRARDAGLRASDNLTRDELHER